MSRRNVVKLLIVAAVLAITGLGLVVLLFFFNPFYGKVSDEAQRAMMDVAVRDLKIPEEEIQTVAGVSFRKCVSRLFRTESEFSNVVAIVDDDGKWNATWHPHRVDRDAYSTEAECFQAYEDGVEAAKSHGKN